MSVISEFEEVLEVARVALKEVAPDANVISITDPNPDNPTPQEVADLGSLNRERVIRMCTHFAEHNKNAQYFIQSRVNRNVTWDTLLMYKPSATQ